MELKSFIDKLGRRGDKVEVDESVESSEVNGMVALARDIALRTVAESVGEGRTSRDALKGTRFAGQTRDRLVHAGDEFFSDNSNHPNCCEPCRRGRSDW